MNLLQELYEEYVAESYGMTSGWIVPGKGIVDAQGMRHAEAVFLDPEAFGFSDEELERFCPNLVQGREELFNEKPFSGRRPPDYRPPAIHDCFDKNDGEWSEMYRFLYGNGLFRYFVEFDFGEASFSGRAFDFLKYVEQGLVQRTLKGYNGPIHLSLDVNGKVKEQTFQLQRGDIGGFWMRVKQFASGQ